MRVRILGAGIIGLFCAEELISRGHTVTVVDPRPASGASFVAAGMLSPSAEVWHGEEALLDVGLRSLALWPDAAARLGVPLHTGGTLLVGSDHGDLQQVERQCALLAAQGREVALLDRRSVLDHEPALGPRVAGGALLPDEASVDPRAVLSALLGRVAVVPEDAGGNDVTVVATGALLPEPFRPLVRGVRGEIVRVRGGTAPGRTVRGWVRGEPVYVVPRPSGEIVVGATSEEHDGPPVPTVGGTVRLLQAARELIPGLDRAEITEVRAGDRPGTADNLPLVGPSGVDGVVLAAGHYRHGVLLAPLTARLVADHLETGSVEPALDPRRFATEGITR
ncbi:FAD-dependent oxidoreductase [Nocardioides pocheonensis]|uniref:FAD-dependent oxidoreductase n=1 Tax=Nocardioides pocheonensis TaxID=661485 RepID=A0A3N0GI43_9ACTN|nr:FAD-dependent oxidoreductase [Nocardioides pocheonensis]RNM12154.1 FAD-dependent oxidoreductase [Nocardioides pocheonensis]